jgi:hypothetical protein
MGTPGSRQLTLPLRSASRMATAPARQEPPRPPVAPVLPPPPSPALAAATSLAERLASLLGERVQLTLTDNTSTMVSFRRTRGLVAFRVHHMFAAAPPNVVRALADYASGSRASAGRLIDEYVRSNEDDVRQTRTERQVSSLEPLGRYFDLQAMFDELNRDLFGGAVDAAIGWGREAPRRRRRSIKMGTYFHDTRVIRIHPALDRPEVPDYFVRFIVFHEMLHHVIPPVLSGGRRISHTPEFRRRERAYPDYGRAIAWERKHLTLLLGRARGRPEFDLDDPLA